jgi:hypothetical protein
VTRRVPAQGNLTAWFCEGLSRLRAGVRSVFVHRTFSIGAVKAATYRMNRTLHAHDAKLGKLSERSATVLRNKAQVSAPQGRRRDCLLRAVKTVTAPAPAIAPAQAPVKEEPTRPKPARAPLDYNQQVRQGHYEASLMQKQVRALPRSPPVQLASATDWVVRRRRQPSQTPSSLPSHQCCSLWTRWRCWTC